MTPTPHVPRRTSSIGSALSAWADTSVGPFNGPGGTGQVGTAAGVASGAVVADVSSAVAWGDAAANARRSGTGLTGAGCAFAHGLAMTTARTSTAVPTRAGTLRDRVRPTRSGSIS